jgi:hypothetical protein
MPALCRPPAPFGPVHFSTAETLSVQIGRSVAGTANHSGNGSSPGFAIVRIRSQICQHHLDSKFAPLGCI